MLLLREELEPLVGVLLRDAFLLLLGVRAFGGRRTRALATPHLLAAIDRLVELLLGALLEQRRREQVGQDDRRALAAGVARVLYTDKEATLWDPFPEGEWIA